MCNPDIVIAAVVLYLGDDAAARQEASIVTGSMLAAQLIEEHNFLVQRFLNGLVDKLRYDTFSFLYDLTFCLIVLLGQKSSMLP